MHRRHKNMNDGKSAQTERRQNRSSSLSLFVFLETYRLPPWLDYSWLSQHLLWFCQEPWFILDSKLSMKKHVIKICQTAYFEYKRISSIRRFLTEDATKTLVTSYILSRLDYCNCLLMGHLILSSNLYRKFRTLLQDLFSWQPVTTTQHLSWKNCTVFPFQNVLSIKSLVCISVL